MNVNSFWQTATLFEIGWTFIALIGAYMCLRAYIAYIVVRAEIQYWPSQQERKEMGITADEGAWREVVRFWWHVFFFIAGILGMFNPPNPNIEVHGVALVLSIFFPLGIIILECVSVGQTLLESRNKERRMVLGREQLALLAGNGIYSRVGVKDVDSTTPSVSISDESNS